MLKKRTFKKLAEAVVVISFLMWTQAPVMAQKKTLPDQLAETKVAIAEQTWGIEQFANNFSKIKETGFIKVLTVEQDETIIKISNNCFLFAITEQRQIEAITKTTDNFFKVTGELNNKRTFLKAVYEAKVVFSWGIRHNFWKRPNKSLEKEVIKLPAFLDQKSRSPIFFFSPKT